jgi:hypothetical protein
MAARTSGPDLRHGDIFSYKSSTGRVVEVYRTGELTCVIYVDFDLDEEVTVR